MFSRNTQVREAKQAREVSKVRGLEGMNIVKIPPEGVVGMNLTQDLVLNLDTVVFWSTITRTKIDNTKATHTILQLSCGSTLELSPLSAQEVLAAMKSSKKNDTKRGHV